MIGNPSSPRVLLPVIAGRRGCALRRLYALRGDVAENEAVLAAARIVLRRYQADPTASLIWSPASTIPGTPITGAAGTSAGPAAGSRTPSARTNRPLPDCSTRSSGPAPRQLLLCGDSTLALAILRELARRAWERQELADAAAKAARGLQSGLPPAGRAAAAPVQHVLLLDRRAEDLRREFLATSPPSVVRALCDVRAEPRAVDGRAARHAGRDAARGRGRDRRGRGGCPERARHARGRAGGPAPPRDPRLRADLGRWWHERRDLRSAAPFPAGAARGRGGTRGHLDPGGPPLARVLPAQPSAGARRPEDPGQPALGQPG